MGFTQVVCTSAVNLELPSKAGWQEQPKKGKERLSRGPCVTSCGDTQADGFGWAPACSSAKTGHGVREGWKVKNSGIWEGGRRNQDTEEETQIAAYSEHWVVAWERDEAIAERNVVEGMPGGSVQDKLKRWTEQLKGKPASKREIKNTLLTLANENISLLLPGLKGSRWSVLSCGAICCGHCDTRLEEFFRGNSGRTLAPKGRAAVSASKQAELNIFVYVYCDRLCNWLAIATHVKINFSSVRLNCKFECWWNALYGDVLKCAGNAP